MRGLTGARRALNRLGHLSPAQRGLTVVIAVTPAILWGCSLRAGAAPWLWTLIVVIVLSLFTAIEPDSNAGLFTVIFLCWYWLTHVSTRPGDATSPWALGAGLCLLAFHTATAARATAPGPADLDPAFWRRWLGRVAIIATALGGVWGLTAVMASQHPGRDSLTLAAFATLVGSTAYARWAVVRGQ
jgi:hypothetical protein